MPNENKNLTLTPEEHAVLLAVVTMAIVTATGEHEHDTLVRIRERLTEDTL